MAYDPPTTTSSTSSTTLLLAKPWFEYFQHAGRPEGLQLLTFGFFTSREVFLLIDFSGRIFKKCWCSSRKGQFNFLSFSLHIIRGVGWRLLINDLDENKRIHQEDEVCFGLTHGGGMWTIRRRGRIWTWGIQEELSLWFDQWKRLEGHSAATRLQHDPNLFNAPSSPSSTG